MARAIENQSSEHSVGSAKPAQEPSVSMHISSDEEDGDSHLHVEVLSASAPKSDE